MATNKDTQYDAPVFNIINVIAALREVDELMPLNYAQAFLCVAIRPGVSMGELEKMVGISQASVSRAVAALSEWHRLGKPGYGLVEAHEDPTETRRRKGIFLSKKGKDVMTKVVRAATPGKVVSEFPALTFKEYQNDRHRAYQRQHARA
jgi:DNA-binding MarR family transcriptional regulator